MDKTPWGQVLLFVGAGIVAAFQVGKVPPVIPAIRADFGLSLFLAGWILSIFNISGIMVGPVAGAVSDAFGHRRLLLGGLFCQAAGSLIGSFSAGPSLLLTTRIFEGVGFFTVVVAAPALVFRITRPQDLRIALSAWSCFMPAGVAIVMLLIPGVTAWFGWRGLWQINAAILTVYAVWLARLTTHLSVPSSERIVRPAHLWNDVKRTTTSGGPVLLAGIFVTYALQWLAVVGFLPTLLVEGHGFSPGRASALTAIVVVMNVPGNLAGGWLLHKGFRRWRLIAAACLIMGLCSMAIYSSALPFAARYLACLLFSSVGGLLPASVLGGYRYMRRPLSWWEQQTG